MILGEGPGGQLRRHSGDRGSNYSLSAKEALQHFTNWHGCTAACWLNASPGQTNPYGKGWIFKKSLETERLYIGAPKI